MHFGKKQMIVRDCSGGEEKCENAQAGWDLCWGASLAAFSVPAWLRSKYLRLFHLFPRPAFPFAQHFFGFQEGKDHSNFWSGLHY